MAKCVICNKDLEGGALSTKDKYELTGGSFICKECGAKIGIKSIFSAAAYNAEKAKKKYSEMYPNEQGLIKSKESIDDKHVTELVNSGKKLEALQYVENIAGIGSVEAGFYIDRLITNSSVKSNTSQKLKGNQTENKGIFYLKGIGGQLTVYKDRIEISRKGVLGHSYGLAGTKSIPISSIRSVQLREGKSLVNGFIQFGVAGGIEAQGGVMKAADDENTVIIAKGEQTEIAIKIKQYVEKRIAEMSSVRQGGTTIINNNGSAADEILKFKQLADAGIITNDEFEAKKKQLLGL